MSDPSLRRTPLYDLHLERGARMVSFAGYEMPVHYPAGVLKEHLHTRSAAGLFDVSHMGQILLHGPDAARALETLVPADIVGLAPGRQRYGLFTGDDGGILDDLMVANTGRSLLLVVNAARKHADLAHLRQRIGDRCRIEPLFQERALLALQGPSAATVLARLAPSLATMAFMQWTRADLLGNPCQVSRSGYTGEDGYEISVPAAAAGPLARALLTQPEVRPVGLGARDSLRLEAGLCLYGHDMDARTTAIEAGLGWAISRSRRIGGARPGGYPGAARLQAQQDEGVARRRVGFLVEDRMPVREGAGLVDADGQAVGRISSGGFAPTLGAPVAMGYLDAALAKVDAPVQALVRGRPVPLRVARTPFVPHRYHRD
ncbi:glycine cleavage system protein T [Pseudoxanthomonas broegbernensis]|uniref:aminomethyltransferase n=1 Tax=Pseudoxanthomonas broegbernensis TaxID=83619 RepID=A0A7V8GKH2_9GAMM|nr:glycine cleavage system aminomethyltransferase GcvT [Pseudoxanthomonas broegbernensis]KAF1685098.1 glycine cleavage system protein T [Pseudoxanthomonas broegbernensis]MBB6066239.1 aminomethyltransferase [Pseudoxanthomonas broegbernensis]